MVTLDSIFGFGKYKGLTIKDIWTGPALNYRNVIKEYFIGLSEFIRTDYNQSTSFIIPQDYPPLEDLWNTDLQSAAPFRDFKMFVSEKYLTIEAEDIELISRLNAELQKIFRGRFDVAPINKLTKGGKGRDTILTECLKISADPHYIFWCIRTIDKFSIDQDEFEKLRLLDSHILERIKLEEIRGDLFEYKPIYKISRIKISNDIEEINSQKIDSINKVRNSETYDHEDGEVKTFGEYSGSYAQDVMRFSDQEIDDIFDGDPDTYWNID